MGRRIRILSKIFMQISLFFAVGTNLTKPRMTRISSCGPILVKVEYIFLRTSSVRISGIGNGALLQKYQTLETSSSSKDGADSIKIYRTILISF